MGSGNGPRHRWRGKEDEQVCELCGRSRVRIANPRQRPGRPRGYHWEYWHNSALGPNAGSCAPKEAANGKP